MPLIPRAYQLVLIADDPVFRLGWRVWLEQFPEFDLAIEAADGSEALRLLQPRLAPTEAIATAETINPETINPEAINPEPVDLAKTVDLIVVDQVLGRADSSRMQGMSLCRELHSQFPQLPVLLLGVSAEPIMIAAAQQLGVTGYCLKTAETEAIATALRQVANHQPYWTQPSTGLTPPEAALVPPSLPTPPLSPSPSLHRSPFLSLKRHLRQSGTHQIDQAIADINVQLRHPDLSLLDQAVLAGRRRELRTARWVVQRLLATSSLATPPPATPEQTTPPSGINNHPADWRDPTPAGASQRLQVTPAALVPQSRRPLNSAGEAESPLSARSLRSMLFERILSNLQGSLENLTGMPLETDILRADKKSELFYLILRKLETLLDDLRFSQVPLHKLPDMRSQLLLDLWQATTSDFFGRYASVSVGNEETEIVSDLLPDADLVQTEILEKIPLFAEMLAHLLYQSPLVIDSVSYAAGNPEALQRADALLSHTVIQLANAVMQPLLNHFADVEAVKQAFYNRRLISSREIERFRNDLSWRYRLQRFFAEPRDIFESQYCMFVFCDRGIKTETIYSPRREELEQLSGIPLVVTLVLETRDAVAPRLRSAVSFVGSGVVYVLTEVIGRGIGLIGRGILKGVGNVVQDGRYGRNGERPR